MGISMVNPKPDKIGETRPISLCDDGFCHIAAEAGKWLMEAAEKTGIIHKG
jgi:hypothetical protein